MNKYISIGVLSILFFACSREIKEDMAVKKDISFTGIINNTKVSVDKGVSLWETGDAIGVFSKEGFSNYEYVTQIPGQEAKFESSSANIPNAEEYLAYYPYSASGNKDYSNISIAAPATQLFYADGSSLTEKPLSGKGLASDAVDGIVPIKFSPVLPVLELGLTGSASISGIEIELLGESSLNASVNSYFSGVASLDLDTRELVCSSLNDDSHKIIAKFVDAGGKPCNVQLSTEKALRIQLVTGRFVASEGVRIIFSYSDGGIKSKEIWKDKTVNAYTENTNAHIYQPITVPEPPFVPNNTRPVWLFGELNGWNNVDTYSMYPMFKENTNLDNYIYTYTGYMPKGAFKLLPEEKLGTYQAYAFLPDTDKAELDESGTAPAFWNETAGFKTIVLNIMSGEISISDYDVSADRIWNTIGFIGTFNGWGTDWDMSKLSDLNNHIWTLDCQIPAASEYNCGKFRAEDDWVNIWNNMIGLEWSTPFGKMTTSTENDVNIFFDAASADYRVIFNDVTGHYILLRK